MCVYMCCFWVALLWREEHSLRAESQLHQCLGDFLMMYHYNCVSRRFALLVLLHQSCLAALLR